MKIIGMRNETPGKSLVEQRAESSEKKEKEKEIIEICSLRLSARNDNYSVNFPSFSRGCWLLVAGGCQCMSVK